MTRTLQGTPTPFSPTTDDKQAALAHFEPHGSLISRGQHRAIRREFNDDAANFAASVRRQADGLLGALRSDEELIWPAFTEAWYAAAREIVLGPRAAEDRELTEQLGTLRAHANWVSMRPVSRSLRERFVQRLSSYVRQAEPGSLAELVSRRKSNEAEPLDQITQWLFAFDGGGMTAFRALALLSTHPEQARRAKPDVDVLRGGACDLPYLRASFLDAARLWPTTPVILRQLTEAIQWDGATLPAGTNVIAYVPFFTRDDERLGNANAFDPEQWLGADPGENIPFVSFSAGPGACPGRHVVSLVGSVWLASLLAAGHYEFIAPRALNPGALPISLYPFDMRFRFSR